MWGRSGPGFGGIAAIFWSQSLLVVSLPVGATGAVTMTADQGPGILEGKSQRLGFERRWVSGAGAGWGRGLSAEGTGQPPIAFQSSFLCFHAAWGWGDGAPGEIAPWPLSGEERVM